MVTPQTERSVNTRGRQCKCDYSASVALYDVEVKEYFAFASPMHLRRSTDAVVLDQVLIRPRAFLGR